MNGVGFIGEGGSSVSPFQPVALALTDKFVGGKREEERLEGRELGESDCS